MNVLHILGNGFDKNLGLNTGYNDFYRYYKKIKNEDSVIIELKKNISLNSNNWSDLEMALGNYTNSLSKEDFEKVYEDLVDNLCNYLNEEETLFNEGIFDKNKMFSFLAFPSDYLEYKDKVEIDEFIANKQEEVTIDVITLNYTKTLERILFRYGNQISYGLSRERIPHVLGRIKHIHGYTDNRVILGVNDKKQILNETFHADIEIEGMFIKYKTNSNQRHNTDSECYDIIEKADLIYIYGSSLGETDKYLWELLGKRLQDGAKVVIFDRGTKINFRLCHQITRAMNDIKNRFITLANISDEYNNSIHIGLKTNMFQFD